VQGQALGRFSTDQPNQSMPPVFLIPAERFESVILSDGLAVISAGQQILGRAATEPLV